MRGRLQQLGILRESGTRALQRVDCHSGLRPRRPRHGNVRPQDHARDLRPGTPLHLYLPGPHRGVWNEEALAVIERDHSLRGAHRCADVLVRRVTAT